MTFEFMNETTAVLTTEYQPPSDPSPAETDEFTPTNGTEVETEKRKKPRISHKNKQLRPGGRFNAR